MPTTASDQALALKRLAAAAARKRVSERELEREIYDAAVIRGLTQRKISGLAGIPGHHPTYLASHGR
ncbi:putative uncharacterized protein [Mycolicibacterium fortuitum subsp. acetamidolyticum]|uniref:Uncharacterized protein n=1 Tax=Mycolicibacterium fortuitum subsp. acetamidolyticum TaxID=144550 RepID=A0A124E4P8_MYCFO|nr:putative uncharacterized protein [Mycolicibacterium fortuitum subsp. acetamidolyticum]